MQLDLKKLHIFNSNLIFVVLFSCLIHILSLFYVIYDVRSWIIERLKFELQISNDKKTSVRYRFCSEIDLISSINEQTNYRVEVLSCQYVVEFLHHYFN